MNISVIIPTYNRRELLLRAISSVQNQSLKPKEIIVIDDGSTDGTEDLFPMDGVIYKKITHGGFPGRTRNRGVEISQWDHICFLDSDDEWLPEKLERQALYFQQHRNCIILHTKERWIMNGKLVSQKKRKFQREGYIFQESLQGCIMGPSTIMMTKELFQNYSGFREDIEVGEDYELWLRITDREYIHYIDEECIIKYAGHGDQLSFKYGYIEPFKIDVLEGLIQHGSLQDFNRDAAITSLKEKYEIVINGCTKRRRLDTAAYYNNKRNNFLQTI